MPRERDIQSCQIDICLAPSCTICWHFLFCEFAVLPSGLFPAPLFPYKTSVAAPPQFRTCILHTTPIATGKNCAYGAIACFVKLPDLLHPQWAYSRRRAYRRAYFSELKMPLRQASKYTNKTTEAAQFMAKFITQLVGPNKESPYETHSFVCCSSCFGADML